MHVLNAFCLHMHPNSMTVLSKVVLFIDLLHKQKELEAMIRQQQDELKKMKKQRASEEEEVSDGGHVH